MGICCFTLEQTHQKSHEELMRLCMNTWFNMWEIRFFP